MCLYIWLDLEIDFGRVIVTRDGVAVHIISTIVNVDDIYNL